MSRSVYAVIRVCVVLLIMLCAGLPSALSQSANPSPLATEMACPSNQTVWLEGFGPPFQAVLISLQTRPVGGGTVNAAGTWRLPLRVQEMPGVYDVEVNLRGEPVTLARFICYVDVAFELPTATPSNTPTALPPTMTTSPTDVPLPSATGVLPSPTSTATASNNPTATGTVANDTPTATIDPSVTTTATLPVDSTSTATATPISTPTPSLTATPRPETLVQLIEVFQGDLDTSLDPVDWGFAVIVNDSDATVEMTGWTITNQTRPGLVYRFPNFRLLPLSEVTVYVGDDGINTDDELYWGANERVWLNGETIVLSNERAQEISRCVVGRDICN
jgi:hypothetical protein